MDKVIDAYFLRVEKALATLINSIATYNPSPQLATDLVNADEELIKGLELVSKHQANHARIQFLRSTAASLDDQIKSTLTLFSETRAELIAIPATVLPLNTYPVSYSELLSYARRISKFTIPPTFREADTESTGAETTSLPKDAETKDAQASQLEFHDGGSKTNGTPTPTVTNGVLAPASQSALNSGDAGTATPVDGENNTSLPTVISTYLNPLSGTAPFVPWPTEEVIRRGALQSIQVLLDSGIDPATFDPAKSAELEAERQRLEEEAEARRAAQEAEKTRVEQEKREELQRTSVGIALKEGGATQTEKKPAVFNLDILDDDMDDDDE